LDAYTYKYEINWKDLVKGRERSGKNSSLKEIDRTFLENQKRNLKSKKDLKTKNKKISNLIYGFAFFIVIICLFFLATNLSFASPVSENLKGESIFSDENSSSILNEYVFEDEKKNDKDNIANLKIETLSEVKYSKYRVKGKDTVESVAYKFGLISDSIILCNDIKKKNALKAGRILTVPDQNGRIIYVGKNDSLYKIAGRYGVAWQKIVDVNNIKSPEINFGAKLFIPGSKMTKYEKDEYEDTNKIVWPVKGKITSYFGPRIDPFKGVYSYHTGIDIKNESGSPVKAVKDGIVVFTGYDKIYGNNVIIKHSDGYTSRYAHLSGFKTAKGKRATQNSTIGTLGSTGRSTGPHLHFEIRKYGKLIDPLKLLE